MSLTSLNLELQQAIDGECDIEDKLTVGNRDLVTCQKTLVFSMRLSGIGRGEFNCKRSTDLRT